MCVGIVFVVGCKFEILFDIVVWFIIVVLFEVDVIVESFDFDGIWGMFFDIGGRCCDVLEVFEGCFLFLDLELDFIL